MAELLPSEVPLKKRKIEAVFPDQESSCRQVPVSLLSSTELLLQIPPNTNTSLPVWECLSSAQAEVLWSVTPYSITVQITPLTTQKAQSNDQPVTQPQPHYQSQNLLQLQLHLPTLKGQGRKDGTDLPSVFFKLAAKTFFTKSSKYINICDDFLIGCCQYKLNSQVKLEKLYCDADQETIKLQDMTEMFTLQLNTMKVSSEKYDKARRLSNSQDPGISPYFPTEWSIYWWNDCSWEKYEKKVSKELLGAMEAGETSYGFYIGNQLYEVDFRSLTQMNLTTMFKRRIRRRPTFCSPFSIRSHLKTVVLGETRQPFGEVLPSLSVDPLQEFSSWYPPVWTLSPDQGFSLVEVPPSAKAYQSIHCLFYSTMSETKTEIISIEQVQNIFQWDKYRRQKEHMQSRSTAQNGSLERHLFHGTTEDSAKEICLNNFDPRVSGKNGMSYGRGSYFARDASYSFKYAARFGEVGCQHMFLAKVLVGNVTLGNSMYYRPPNLNPLTPGYELYDTCVDQIADPSIFVVFDNCQCYPYYLIKYKVVSDIVNICE
ncbi:hypothetical protein SKAU_G00025960 [Synaphobranchus kaupii]|uniref:Poly [ADP-ribose] polymerase n=1 Tax=Synaphobranchus kaupii TaxID=118154 RepID=A0A9Q1GDQ0_SYNKA|nr:hypothetical protein SKAU_G00025960 [Synaphobranchus kaupii]